jgi:hypothetical protein
MAVALGAVVVALVVTVLALALQGKGSGSGGAAAATTSAAPPTVPPSSTVAAPPISPAPTGPTADATALPASQEPVPLEETARVGEVDVSLVAVEEIQGRATGPGDVAGPALRITVQLENGTADPLDLLGVSVTMTYGTDAVPASPLGDPSVALFSGVLEPGESAEGIYVFRVPADVRDAVSVSVGYQPGAPFAVFSGAV